jgi:hypothetical protein
MRDTIRYYVIVYDCASGQAGVQEADDLEAAIAGYRNLRREKAELGRNDVDVLLAGADDLLTLEKVHGMHFTTTTSIEDFSRPFERPTA